MHAARSNPTPPRPPRHRRWIWLLVACVVIVLVLADQRGWLLVPAHDDFARYHSRLVRVTRVIDGDTVEIDLADPVLSRSRTRVRLWGIDAPERGTPGKVGEPLAQEATAFVESLVDDALLRLHLEEGRVRGTYDRVLAHLELPDGSMLNRRLLLEGFAKVDDRWPHTRLTHYAQAQRAAQLGKRNIWAEELE